MLTYKGEPVTLERRHYGNGRTALQLLCADGADEPMATCTVNLPEEPLAADEVAVKDYSENEGMLDWLIENGIVAGPPLRWVPSGYVQIPICKLLQAHLDVQCRQCHQTFAVPATADQVRRWREGELIQQAMPDVPAPLRELLITGMCGACFDKIFPPEED